MQRLAVLNVHILNLDGEKLAVALGKLKHLPRLHDMDVHLYHAALSECHHGIAEGGHFLAEIIYRKIIDVRLFAHKAQQKLCAIAECELAVFGEKRDVGSGRTLRGRRLGTGLTGKFSAQYRQKAAYYA